MTAPARPLRWGILGCARISRRGLIPGILGSRSGTLHAIASRDLANAQAWASEFSIPVAHGSYDALLDDPGVDAVYLPLPNELHKPWTLAAADRGKHVLCEKPLAIDAAEARTMVEHCRARGVILMEAFMWPHQPRTADLLQLVRRGDLGDVRLIRTSFSITCDPGDWRLDASRGGGGLWDVGTYGVSAARLYAGSEPTSVRSRAHFGPTGVDLTLTAELAFPGDILGLIDCSFEQPLRCRYEVVGTLGSIEVPDAFLPPDRPTALLRSADGSTRELQFDGRDQYAAMVDAFALGVDRGGLQRPAEDGLAQMEALDAILAAARSA